MTLPGSSTGRYRCLSFGRSPRNRFQANAKRPHRGALLARDTHWAQYAFQFAHELCHALANFASNSERLQLYPPQANLWLEESLCETASLFTLRAMSRSWRTEPPNPAWRNYAPCLDDYAEQRLELP